MKLSKFFEKNKKFSEIFLLFSEIAIEGLALNFMVFCVFNLPFTWYSWFGWGLIPYILGEVLPRVWVKFKKRLE